MCRSNEEAPHSAEAPGFSRVDLVTRYALQGSPYNDVISRPKKYRDHSGEAWPAAA